jgi:exopolysaccharide biosynthesis polyprenyl glycosylphosphotransferase
VLKQQAKVLTRITKFADIITIFAAFALAYMVRINRVNLDDFTAYLWVMLVVIPTWHLLMTHYKLYASIRLHSPLSILVSLTKVHFIGGIIASSAVYFVEPKGYSRGLFLLFLFFSYIFLIVAKLSLKYFLNTIRQRGYNTRNILIVGTSKRAINFARVVEQHGSFGLKIVGFVGVGGASQPERLGAYPILGNIDRLAEICKGLPVDEVVFGLPRNSPIVVEEHLRDLEEMGITVRMVLDTFDVHTARRELDFFHNSIPILTFYSKAFDGTQLMLKRCLDLAGALVGLLITAVLFPFIALAIKANSPGPLFFGQVRIGENGRHFTCWKFRSMYLDAEERKQELLAQNEMSGAIFKIKNDPRVTPVGSFLRKTSLDELPQFWNVLKAEMSLVGTRPPTPEEVAHYEDWHRRRSCIRPGITGMWQVSGRNEITDFDEIVRLDLKYIDGWTLWLDIMLLFKTVWVVFARKGSS